MASASADQSHAAKVAHTSRQDSSMVAVTAPAGVSIETPTASAFARSSPTFQYSTSSSTSEISNILSSNNLGTDSSSTLGLGPSPLRHSRSSTSSLDFQTHAARTQQLKDNLEIVDTEIRQIQDSLGRAMEFVQ